MRAQEEKGGGLVDAFRTREVEIGVEMACVQGVYSNLGLEFYTVL